MFTEIEAKLKVESLKDIEERLAEVGAEFLAEQSQTDSYFDDTKSSLQKSDRALRLRRQVTENEEKFLLTYKGAREKDNFKKRQEIEIEIKDTVSTENLLSALGYEKVLEFEKQRCIWQLDDCEVALDQLPLLGSFVEIEGANDEKISTVQGKLGLSELRHIPESYATLVADKLLHQPTKNNK